MSITAEIEQVQRRHDLFTAVLWSPAALLMLMLAIGFHAYSPGAVSSSFVDTLLNVLALGGIVSLAGIPIGLWGRARASHHLEELSIRALHTPEEPSSFGPILHVGGIRARVAADGTLLLIRRLSPLPIRWLVNSAMVASAVGLLGVVKFPNSGSIATVLVLLILAGVVLIPWALANWVSVTRIRSNGLELRASCTDGPWMFGPIRWRSGVVPLPCLASGSGGRLSITNGKRFQQIATLPESSYGQWQGSRLRRWLEEMLQVSLSEST